ncbi:MAG: hypothetical protein ABSB41_01800 [Anaerolineales bacterium]
MKRILLALLTILVFTLSACAGMTTPTATQAQTTSSTVTAATLNTSYTDALPVASQLLVGTFKLEGTNQSVTASQAKILIPLWQQVQSLSQSLGAGPGVAPQGHTNATPSAQATSSHSQKQIDELVKQIQAAMTTDQIQAIAAMKITQDSAMTILQKQGITTGGPGGQPGNGAQPLQGNPQAGNGQQPPQGTPAGGIGQSAQGNPPDNGQANMPTGPGSQAGLLSPNVINSLVQLLQQKAGVPTSTPANSSSAPANAPSSSSSSSTSTSTATGAYTLNGGSASQNGQTYTGSNVDESAVYVTDGGVLTLGKATITTSGNTSSQDNSSFYGINAGVLATGGSTINLSNSSVTTSGTGANGAFSTGAGTTVTLSNVKITATGDGAHAVMATQGGTMVVTNVDMTTAGGSASAIATDRGGGTITVTGGTVKTTGMNSAGIYSTGNITVTNGTFTAEGAEAAVIEGANSITLTNTSLSSSKAGKWGVMIYQSTSGDAQGTKGTFTMTGGSLAYTATDGPLFYITNSTGVITLKGVSLTAASGTLVKAASGSWGNSGSNGGTVLLTADGQTLTGNLVADNLSSITLNLQNGSSLTGAINPDKTAKATNLTLDSTSTWTVTADSYLSGLSDASGISGSTITNIIGNGHTLYYDASLAANSQLGGKTYTFSGGGSLKPAN